MASSVHLQNYFFLISEIYVNVLLNNLKHLSKNYALGGKSHKVANGVMNGCGGSLLPVHGAHCCPVLEESRR